MERGLRLARGLEGDAADGATAGVVFVALGIAGLQVHWVVRFCRWWSSGRAPAQRYQARLTLSRSPRSLVDAVWPELYDGQSLWYQRILWEPWLAALGRRPVRWRRAERGNAGRSSLTSRDNGRIWPAGRGRRNPPWLESLVAGAPNPRLYARPAPLRPLADDRRLRFARRTRGRPLGADGRCGGRGVPGLDLALLLSRADAVHRRRGSSPAMTLTTGRGAH